jgi:putative SOS response-associated peptidase YedK
MCGRYTLFTPRSAIEERFGATFDRPFEPRYNCAPGQALPVVTDADPDRFSFTKWGLIPAWADDDSTSFINARAETVREKRSFAEPFESRRCLVPADGFYEWVERGEGKQPYRVAYEDDRPFAMAGLWERWTPPTRQAGLGEFGGSDGGETEPVETFTVVTTEPNAVVSDLHHRMAVVLAPDEEETWLHGDPDEAAALLDPPSADDWHAYPVSTRVNSPANDGPELVEAVE